MPRPYFSRASLNCHVIRVIHRVYRRDFSSHLSHTTHTHTHTHTEPGRLQVTPSQPLMTPQVLLSGVPWNLHRGAMDILVTVFRIMIRWQWLLPITDHLGSDICGHRIYSGPCTWLKSSATFLLQAKVSAHFRRIWNVFAQMFVFAVLG